MIIQGEDAKERFRAKTWKFILYLLIVIPLSVFVMDFLKDVSHSWSVQRISINEEVNVIKKELP